MDGFLYHRLTRYDRGSPGKGWRWNGDPPGVFKSYPNVPFYKLPEPGGNNLYDVAVSMEELFFDTSSSSSRLTKENLGLFLYLCYGITASLRGGDYFFRTVPSAGALYPCELYAALEGMDDLPSGLYHYSVARHGLEQIALTEDGENVDRHGLEGTLFLKVFVTGVIYRSSSKYNERALRYVLLDAGHLVEQVLLSGKIVRFGKGLLNMNPSEVSILALDPSKEVLIGSVTFGQGWLEPQALRYTDSAEKLASRSAAALRDPLPPLILDVLRDLEKLSPGLSIPYKKLTIPTDFCDPEKRLSLVEKALEAFLLRRSRRDFLKDRFMDEAMFRSLCCCFKDMMVPENLDVFFCVERIEDIDSGLYKLTSDGLVQMKKGSFMKELSRSCLNQGWLSNCCVHVICTGRPFTKTSDTYKYVVMTAGRLGQRIYLAAESLGLGCCGVGAFYDREVAEFLNLSENEEVIYLLGIGFRRDVLR